jgi:hypothetical protein
MKLDTNNKDTDSSSTPPQQDSDEWFLFHDDCLIPCGNINRANQIFHDLLRGGGVVVKRDKSCLLKNLVEVSHC